VARREVWLSGAANVRNELCRMTGADFPLFAFSHCRNVVAAVSRAGGFGVLGGSSFTPQSLQVELDWIDSHVDGKPYGVDLLVPENLDIGPDVSVEQLAQRITPRHRQFVMRLLARHDISISADELVNMRRPPLLADVGEQLLEVAFRHPIRLIANALGIAPPAMIERARQQGVPVAALVGAREHAIRQINAGVDIIVAQGGEAGGHCGEVSTLVLVPEVIKAIAPLRAAPVLAAGGIVNGRQMAGCMAMGAQGAWTGTVWLATTESEVSQTFREKMIAATSRDTVRSRARTGKPARQLRSAWHAAWDSPESPGALPMPLMPMLSQPSFVAIDRAADSGNKAARELVSYFLGQGVGLIDAVRSVREVVHSFREEFAAGYETLATSMAE
jgi:NAD(P)H-dependent flavin oxidoreductase YrpB (nitropropane dioxygenase family)